ncbi:MAG TPA: CAP domain-containing protein [Solirubrobacteraceae bacterium]|nr:CAP domain-containing protein [Solirubrobacteraceae bacterium]
MSVAPPRADAASVVTAHVSRAGGKRVSARRAASQKTSSGCLRAAKARGRRPTKPPCTTAASRATPRRTTPKKTRALPSRSTAQTLTSPTVEPAEPRAAAIARVLSTPCQNTALTPEPSNLPLVRGAVLCLVNTVRAQNGRAPLQPNADLEAAAESHGREMIAVDYFDHISPSGITPVDRVRQSGYIPNSEVGYVVGENLAWGTLTLSTPAAIVEAWVASPEHLANILETKYQDTGIDVRPEVPLSLAEGVEGGLYTQEFGVIVH